MAPEYKIEPGFFTGVYRLFQRNRGWFCSEWCYIESGSLEGLSKMVQHRTKPTLYYDAAGRRIKGV